MSRLAYNNLAVLPGTVITASSEAVGYAASRLRDEGPGITWRSKLGWNITTYNDKLEYDRGGVKTAVIAQGNYATPALLAAAVVAALEAVDNTPEWACSYNAGTKRFAITSNLAFAPKCATGPNVGTSVHRDLGFTSTDKNSGTFQEAENASYKSREWLKVDLGSALAVTAGIVKHHNIGATGTMVLQGTGADTVVAWASPDVSLTLAGNAAIRIAYQASVSKRYWRIIIDDVETNPAGYTEVGHAFLGPYTAPLKNFRTFTKRYRPLSTMAFAAGGAGKRDVRRSRRCYELAWQNVTSTVRDQLLAWIDTALVANFYVGMEDADLTDTVYGYLVGEPSLTPNGQLWHVSIGFEEVLS
jgi:hypothetical protein